MSDAPVRYTLTDQVAFVTIDREAQRNALNPEAVSLLLSLLDQAEADAEVRAVCLTGAGDRVFCSGADLGGAMTGSGQEAFTDFARLLKRLSGYPKPTLARVNGSCLAGGMGLMLACDLVLAVNTASFGTPEVKVGLFPMMIGALIFRNVPRKQAMDMVLLGRKLGAQEAAAMGLVTRLVEPGDLDREVGEVLAELTAKSPIGMRIGKQAFHAMADMPFDQAVDYLSGKLAEVSATEDAREGITAFLEKRPPWFTGR